MGFYPNKETKMLHNNLRNLANQLKSGVAVNSQHMADCLNDMAEQAETLANYAIVSPMPTVANDNQA